MKLAEDFRASAREALKNNWVIAVIAAILASVLGVSTGGGVSFSYNFGASDDITVDVEAFLKDPSLKTLFPGTDETFWITFFTMWSIVCAIAFVIGIAFFLLGSIVNVGYCKFNLDLIDTHECSINSLFAYFKHWKGMIFANLLRELYVFLWSLLCFIPGIIASYSYSMVPYILADSPELTAKEACSRSKELMYGNRWRLFCLEISFIGWAILAVLCCGLGIYLLAPYSAAARADFYREISGTRPIPVVDEDIVIYTPAE